MGGEVERILLDRDNGGEGREENTNTLRIRKTAIGTEPGKRASENSSLQLMTISEAAVFLNLKVSKLRSLVFRKEMPFLKFGRLVRFRAQDLEEWVLAHRSTPSGFGPARRDTTSKSLFEIDTHFNKPIRKDCHD